MGKKIKLHHWIRPYKKKDGTKVRGHYRLWICWIEKGVIDTSKRERDNEKV